MTDTVEFRDIFTRGLLLLGFLLAFTGIPVLVNGQRVTGQEQEGDSAEQEEGEESPKEKRRQPLLTKDVLDVIERGRSYLADQQRSNGMIGSRSGTVFPVAVTSLACLALMAGGTVPGRGKHGDVVAQGLNYVLQHSKGKRGQIRSPSNTRLHEHGYATLFLTQVYGMHPGSISVSQSELEEKIKRAIRLIEQSQKSNGGWGYHPRSGGRHEGTVTITQIQALRAARNAGLKVKKSTIDKAVEYVKKSQSVNGGFQYRMGSSRETYALTAAGVSTINYLGFYRDLKGTEEHKKISEMIKKGLDYMERNEPSYGKRWYFYGQFYASQAYYFAGEEKWESYYRDISETLVKKQKSNGSWQGRRGRYSTLYDAFALLILEIPFKMLPIFQK